MPQVHPTAIVDPAAELADDVVVGPFTVIDAGVRIGAGCRVHGQSWLTGPTTLGADNEIFPGARLGFAPQSVAYDSDTPGQGLVVGDRNVFREGFTAHRAMTDEGPTRIGSDGFFMTNSHVGHDSIVGDQVIMASGALLGGHVNIENRVNLGGAAAIHQFVRVGQGAMISGLAASTFDVPARFVVTAVNLCGGINLVGMRRNGMSSEDIGHVKWLYRELYREGRTPAGALDALRERADVPIIAEYVAWLEASDRGWVRRRPTARRAQGS